VRHKEKSVFAPSSVSLRFPFAFVLLAVAAARVASAQEVSAQEGSKYEIYGFAMADYIQDTKRVDPNWEDAFRPSKIGVDDQFGTNGQASVSVKQSRFGFKGFFPAGGMPINFKFEFDFFGVGVDAGQTTIRLRHFYAEWGPILAGQTHSLFMDIDVFPNVIDYWGPSGMVFFRLPQLRWTPVKSETSELAFAIEKPGNDIDPGNIRLVEEFANADIQNDEKVPDFTAHYRMDGKWGHFQLAGMLRRVGYEYRITSNEPWSSGARTGWGIDATSGINTVGKDKLLLSVVHGNGIATYMNDGGMDLAPTAQFGPIPGAPVTVPTLSAEAVPLTGVMAYYDHYWSSKWSTSIGYSFTQVSNTNFQEAVAFHKGDYASVNLLAYPIDKMLVGAELMWGRRTNNNGATGDDTRFQLSVKYDFDKEL
jgi:DcaP outer membrane protein